MDKSDPAKEAKDDHVTPALVGKRYNTANKGDKLSKTHLTHVFVEYFYGMTYKI